ncbi:tumor protein D54 isoform X11 [Ambystoma mexicanum]|uniref:tumor protein D54 isoform X11 n=1 Tax=Ambystoma mexicanum TaxID=8296 RepID=UPI0037E8B4B1
MEPAGQDINLNSPNKGLLADTMTDVPVDVGGAVADPSRASLPEGMTEAEAEELRNELYKVEEEISTLRQVLSAKEKHAWDLKRQLGQTPLNQLKQNFTKGLQEVQMSNAYVSATSTLEDWNEKVTHSEAYKKTQETLSQAGQKTTAALSTVGTAITRKLGDMRNSPTFKSFEDRVGSLKSKVVGSRENGADGLQSPTGEKSPQDNAPF